MEYQHALVVDSEGRKKEFVLVRGKKHNGVSIQTPQYYQMQDGERLIYDGISDALAMLKPKYTTNGWQETATVAEIEEARPKVSAPQPDHIELALAELTMALAALQVQSDLALAEITMMMAGGGIGGF